MPLPRSAPQRPHSSRSERLTAPQFGHRCPPSATAGAADRAVAVRSTCRVTGPEAVSVSSIRVPHTWQKRPGGSTGTWHRGQLADPTASEAARPSPAFTRPDPTASTILGRASQLRPTLVLVPDRNPCEPITCHEPRGRRAPCPHPRQVRVRSRLAGPPCVRHVRTGAAILRRRDAHDRLPLVRRLRLLLRRCPGRACRGPHLEPHTPKRSKPRGDLRGSPVPVVATPHQTLGSGP